ncbi:MAG TPA: nuclear transport factor 2 family protein [Rhizobiaceae bacterium]|nr:nuclear transport factor 2 family protein [Rhizobiaceae bacterium]
MTMADTTNDGAEALLANMFDVEMRFMEAGSNDLSLLATAFHPDVTIHEPASLPYCGDWSGLDGLARLFRRMGETWDGMTVQSMIAAQRGDIVLMSCDIVMTSRTTRKTVAQPFAERLVFRDGLLLEGTPFYYDTAEIAAALA